MTKYPRKYPMTKYPKANELEASATGLGYLVIGYFLGYLVIGHWVLFPGHWVFFPRNGVFDEAFAGRPGWSDV